MILGPGCWWLILLLITPIVVSTQLQVLVVRDFSLLYAVCKPDVDTLMVVEHDSSVTQRSFEELRTAFQSLFVRANPDVDDMLIACDQAFAAADTDGGGTLSHKEFAALVRRLTGEVAPEQTRTRRVAPVRSAVENAARR